METILQEVERALNARLFYLAIVMALTLPDVCAALESPNGRTTPDKYKAWYRAHFGANYPRLTEDDCYGLRCGVVHQGRFGGHGMQHGRIIFMLPNPNIQAHNAILNDALNLDPVTFCHDMIDAVRQWFVANQSTANVQANLPNLVQLRPHGIHPYVGGLAVIA